jgi:hypothetical protein
VGTYKAIPNVSETAAVLAFLARGGVNYKGGVSSVALLGATGKAIPNPLLQLI